MGTTEASGLHGSREALDHVERATDHAAALPRRRSRTRSRPRSRATRPARWATCSTRYLRLLTTEPADADARRRGASRPRCEALPSRAADRARARPRRGGASAGCAATCAAPARELLEVTREHPRDAIALAVGHQIDFFTGDAVVLRDRVGGALSAWREDDPRYGPVLGMYAFGLEEAGHYDRSEEVALRAV